MKKITLNKIAYLTYENEPVIFKNSEIEHLRCFLNKKVKNNKIILLFSFQKDLLSDFYVQENPNNINLSDYSITNRQNIISFISNLKSLVKNKDFKFIRESKMIDFY